MTSCSLKYSWILFHYFRSIEEHLQVLSEHLQSTSFCFQPVQDHQGASGKISVAVQNSWIMQLWLLNDYTFCWCTFSGWFVIVSLKSWRSMWNGRCAPCMPYLVCGLLGVCCTWCMLYLVYAVLGVCCTWCTLYLAYAVLGVCCTWCMLHLVYNVLWVCWTWCSLMIMTWRDTEGWLSIVCCDDGRVVDEKSRWGMKMSMILRIWADMTNQG